MAKNLVNGTSTTIQENGDNISIQIIFPIGYIYMSTSSTNPSVYFGGTWVRIAKGKTLIGVDENDNDFSSAELTGGEKEHRHYNGMSAYNNQLTVSNINSDSSHSADELYTVTGTNGFNGVGTQNVYAYSTENGSSLQPYFTCYIWEKTAL